MQCARARQKQLFKAQLFQNTSFIAGLWFCYVIHFEKGAFNCSENCNKNKTPSKKFKSLKDLSLGRLKMMKNVFYFT